MHFLIVRAGEVALYLRAIIEDDSAVHQMAACGVEATRLERATYFIDLLRFILSELLLSAQLSISGNQCNICFLHADKPPLKDLGGCHILPPEKQRQ